MSGLDQIAAARAKLASLQEKRAALVARKREALSSAAADRQDIEELRTATVELHKAAALTGEPANVSKVAGNDATIAMLGYRAAGSDQAAVEIQRSIDNLDGILQRAQADIDSAGTVYALEEVEAAALGEFKVAIESVRTALARAIAATIVAREDFNHRRRFVSPADFFGAGGAVVQGLHDLGWENINQNLRPDWLPRHGRFVVNEIPGVTEEVAAIRAGLPGTVA
jgi:hypothetical protein